MGYEEIRYSDDSGGATHWTWDLRRSLRALAFALVAAAAGTSFGGGLLAVAPASAAGGRVAEIASPDGTTPLTGGGSGALYSVVLPAGAACPGDTAHKGFLIYSYLLPESVPLTSVSFKTGQPSQGLGYIAAGAYFGAVNTAENTGQIVTLPGDFTWSRWTAAQLLDQDGPRATWDGGIACADTHGRVTNYWNTEIVFVADRSDPRGFRFEVVKDPATGSPSGGAWVIVVGSIGLVLIAVGAAGSFARHRGKARRVRG